MRKVRLRPPANDSRPARRSLVELTAAASRAVDDDMPVIPAFPFAVAVVDAPRAEDVANELPPAAAPRQAKASRAAAPANKPSSRPAALPDSGSTAEMLAQIAKDHQSRALEGIRLGLGAMLDYAKDLSKTPMPAGLPSASGARSEDKLLTAAGAAGAYRAKAIELARANIATALDYARELADATTAAEFVELSSELGRRQCELMLKQAMALQSFAQAVTMPADEEASMPKRLTRD